MACCADPVSAQTPPTRSALPRTTTLYRRHRMWPVWLGAVAIAVCGNIAVVVILGQVSHVRWTVATPPLAVHQVRETVVPPPPPPPPERAPARVMDQPAQAMMPLTLPPLDLPGATVQTDLALPQVGSPDAFLTMPLQVPAFTTIGMPQVDAVMATPGAATPLAVDSPAEREGAFDLARFYPAVARMRHITGWTQVRITVQADGQVSRVEVLDSAPRGVFDQAAENLARALRFRPAQRGGAAVASSVDTRIEWTLQ